MTEPRPAPPARVLGLAALAAVCMLVAVPGFYAGSHGGGAAGVFTAKEKVCSRLKASRCSWHGTFAPDGGGAVKDDMTFTGGGIDRAGDTEKVNLVEGALYQSDDFTWVLLLGIAVPLCGFVAWGLIRRRSEAARSSPRGGRARTSGTARASRSARSAGPG